MVEGGEGGKEVRGEEKRGGRGHRELVSTMKAHCTRMLAFMTSDGRKE